MGNAAMLVRRWLPLEGDEEEEDPDLRGLVAVVTGAGGCVGRQVSLLLASGGCHVVCVDLHPLAGATAQLIRDQHGDGSASAEECDVSRRLEVLDMAARVLRRKGGHVHLLVDAAHHVQDLEAHFWMTLAFLPAMLSRSQGHVVCVSGHKSLAGLLEAFRQELPTGHHLTLSLVPLPPSSTTTTTEGLEWEEKALEAAACIGKAVTSTAKDRARRQQHTL